MKTRKEKGKKKSLAKKLKQDNVSPNYINIYVFFSVSNFNFEVDSSSKNTGRLCTFFFLLWLRR